MIERRRRAHALLASVAEGLLLLLVLAGYVSAFRFWKTNSRLPLPFIFDTYDTFMDWFNTAYYAHGGGAYDIWRSVYPPISFVFLRVAGFSECYKLSPVVARDCDSLGIAAILCSYVLCVLTASLSFWRNDRRTAPLRSLALAFGLPLLFTLERGNLIIVAFPFFVLAHGPFEISRLSRAVATAVTINFKPYLLLPAVGWIIGRRWRMAELVGVAALFVYVVTFGLNGAGSIAQIISNTRYFLVFQTGLIYEALIYSTSYTPFLNIDTYLFPTRDFIPTVVVDAITDYVPIVVRSTQVVAAICLVGAYVQPNVLPHRRIAALLLGAYLVTSSPGGYSSLFLIYLVFMERRGSIGVCVALVSAYLLSIPYDRTIGELFAIPNQAWLANRDVMASFGVSIGLFLRPFGMIVIVWALALDGLHQIILAHRARRPTLDPHPAVLAPREAGA